MEDQKVDIFHINIFTEKWFPTCSFFAHLRVRKVQM